MINLENYEKHKNDLNSNSKHMIEFYKAQKPKAGIFQLNLTSKTNFPTQKLNDYRNPDATMFTIFDESFNELKKYKIITEVKKEESTRELEDGTIEFGVLFTIS